MTAEVFEQAVRSWDRFDPERGTERLFLLGTATVVLRRHGDDERRHLIRLRPSDRHGSVGRDPLVTVRTPDGAPVEPTTPEPTGPADEVTHTMQAVVDLDPDDRDILLLSLWEGCQHAAVAEALDLPVGTVRSSLSRIRRELKKTVAAAKSSGPTQDRSIDDTEGASR